MEENKEIKKGIMEIRKITMTPEEKKRIFENVLSYQNYEEKPVPSPWFSFGFFIQRNRILSYGTMAVLFVVLGGGSFVFASEKSLPGNALYPFKVNFVEPIHSALLLYPEEKVEYESKLATERLVEAETLAKENKLDISKEKQINDLLTKHTVALNEAINKVEKKESREKVYRIAVNFQKEMDRHAQILDETTSKAETKVERKEEKEVKQVQTKNIEVKKEKQMISKNKAGQITSISILPPQATSIGTSLEVKEDLKETPQENSSISIETPAENIVELAPIQITEEIKKESNSISKNARANAQKIKDILEKKYQKE
jgi:hypothetical protein